MSENDKKSIDLSDDQPRNPTVPEVIAGGAVVVGGTLLVGLGIDAGIKWIKKKFQKPEQKQPPSQS